LFGDDGGDGAHALDLLACAPWSKLEWLTHEKSALGLFFSGHPYDAYRPELKHVARTPLAKLQARPDKQWMAGIITGVRVQMGKRGKMCFVTIDDATASMDVMVFAELFDANRHWLKEDQLIVVEGRVSEDRRTGDAEYIGGLRVVADGLMNLDETRKLHARRLSIKLNGGADAKRLMDTLRPHTTAGQTRVTVFYTHQSVSGAFDLGDQWRITPDPQLLNQLRTWIPSDHVQFEYE
jgi:DNA polymerase III subunit alpha